ncbi:hypothetical protein LA303_02240 [Candidatus Sulfidibacterium hydrothermale]|uniref:hypothetical protein n=1 Tax=Candidatus Sulfidibacterium hydrothermale TaxID=2875962 RepID=UPI001F0AA1C2|nr:hypothetical protein [Candidatus Sulfidibacterium hydrothermale]UBM62809.1 hypothetical protein LA303_02240 [Candidatus Sulfidibacterium hydrothermale]
MQQFVTPHEFQEPFPCKFRHNKGQEKYQPSPEIVRTLMAYAAALRIFKTKCAGNFNILMN